MRTITQRVSLLLLLLFAVTMAPMKAAVSVKGTSFSADQLKMGDLLAFEDDSKLNALADLSPDEFLDMKAKDFQELTGEKLSFSERMTFNMVKRQVKKQLKKAEKAASLDQVEKADAFQFKILWFILGLLLGIIALIISLFFGGDAILSTLIGMVIWAVIFFVFIV